MSGQPELSPLTPRAAQIVSAARALLEEEGRDALTMRALADRLGIRAPSLYKHFPDKAAVEAALVEQGLAEMGAALYAALEGAAAGPRAAGPRAAGPRAAGAGGAGAEAGGAEAGGAEAGGVIGAVLRAYRSAALARPALYRLTTSGPLARERLAPGLEEWSGTPLFLAAGEPYLAQALWSFAHGMVVLELDGRYPEGSDLDRTWAEGARAFAARRA
ncbi:TetR/AcrR family transcriptional regulator [Planomonospora venezuelensis]|uniref:AcrR family transcriptional regulator n=1 Tax=Planomonospora venezuelensis TaxID=1999 RepID=A0A841D916_PLAVE|nr:TetR/AcrR family transcriptional regulator [Planomonospora venezuelensis]MBB5965353.1 AcrR family transcriptional regulator [Planomonospora venezuelensis]GIN05614.1 TetR family transcriptional regulator [Planomonospora venezuelensis]